MESCCFARGLEDNCPKRLGTVPVESFEASLLGDKPRNRGRSWGPKENADLKCHYA